MAEQSHKAKEGAINSIVEEANELARRKTEFAITFRKMKADLRDKQVYSGYLLSLIFIFHF